MSEENIQKDQQNEPNNFSYKKARLYVKNLIFDINERLLRNLFSPFGKIIEI